MFKISIREYIGGSKVNKSKKPIKSTKKVNKKQFTINPKIWIVLSAAIGLFLIVAVLFDLLYKRPLVTIDDTDYYLEDMTYHFYSTESYYDYINQMYGGTYWDMPHSEASNMTVRDYAKLETINTVIYQQILYNEAIANDYTLTEEEITKIDEDINSILNEQNLSAKFIKKNGFTSDYLKDVFTKNTLANRYKDDVIESLEINDEEIKAGFNYDDYRQYDIEYLYISTVVMNEEDYSSQPMNEEDKKAALDKITTFREKALDAEDWFELIPEEEEKLQYRESNFLPTDTFFAEDFMNTMMSMENDQISDVIESDGGYYVVRMINNNSPETYDRVVEEAITKAEEEAFGKEYTDNILPNHTFELNEKQIRNLRMGRITLTN